MNTRTRKDAAGARQAVKDVLDGCFDPFDRRAPHRPYLNVIARVVDVDDRTEGRTAAWWEGYQRQLSKLRREHGDFICARLSLHARRIRRQAEAVERRARSSAPPVYAKAS